MLEEEEVIHLYSEECVNLLRQALEKAEHDLEPALTYHDTRRTIDDVSSDENGENEDDSSSSSRGDSEPELEPMSNIPETPTDKPDHHASTEEASLLIDTKKNQTAKRQPKKNPKERQLETLIQQMGPAPKLQLPLDNTIALNVPSSLLVKHERHYSRTACASLLELSHNITETQPVVVLLLRSGRFAGGVFVKNKCVEHRACQRYTVRKGQGKAQSSQDGSRRPKSMGAQLRRQGEVNLWQDVKDTLEQWKKYLVETCLILVSCPKTMQKGLLETAGDVINRDLIRKIPLDIGRPTFESVCAVYEIMMQVVVGEVAAAESNKEDEVTGAMSTACADEPESKKETDSQENKVVVKEFPPLTPLHAFAAEGNVNALEKLLESDADACSEIMEHGAGQDYMTPLHYAAESASRNVDPETAASIVSLLLVQGKTNPCSVDGRNRVPYFLASHDRVREAFRRARAELGEECWPWDVAKVGPALTEGDVARKKEKAAEKKRRQRARQKEKKAREKAEAQAMEQRKKEEDEKRKQEEDAKRIRDGLAPKKSSATNVCDYCQTVCKGKRRNQMFSRLDYVYCSSECVQKHKRELMAQAALSRLG